MTRFELGRQFRLVTVPFRPFQHPMTVEDQLACLDAVRRHLVEGGKLVFDVFNPSLPNLADQKRLDDLMNEPEFTMPDNRRVLQGHRVPSRDLFNQTQEAVLVYCVTHPDGREEHLAHRLAMRHFFSFEMEHLVARSSFTVDQLYADFDKSPYGSHYPGELIFVARRC